MQLSSEQSHDIKNLLMSLESQLFLIKKEAEYGVLSEKMKDHVERLSEKVSKIRKLLIPTN